MSDPAENPSKDVVLPPQKPDQPYIALSMPHPWAWAIVRPDLVGATLRRGARDRGALKDIANCSWQMRVRGWVYVHAGEIVDEAGIRILRDRYVILAPHVLETGGIIGHMRINDCVRRFKGTWGFALALPFWPFRGALGFFGCPIKERTQPD